MSDSTIYSVSGMQEGITNLQNAHRELTTLLDDLKGELSSSLAQWEDNARNSYHEVQRAWDASAAKQQEIVQQLPVLLNNIAEGYNATERANSSLWSS